VEGRALQYPLKAQSRLGLPFHAGRDERSGFLQKVDQFLPQPFDVGSTGLQHLHRGVVVQHGEQQVLHRDEFMSFLESVAEGMIEGELKFFAQHDRTPSRVNRD